MNAGNVEDRAATANAADATVHIERGLAFCRLNQHGAALACFEQAIQIDPRSSSVPYYCRANSLGQLGQFEAAIRSYEQAIAIGSDYRAEAYFERGFALAQLERHELAVESFDRAIALGLKNVPDLHFARGLALTKLGRLELALESFDRAIGLGSQSSADVCVERGNVLWALGRIEAARASYEQAVRENPVHPSALLNLGKLHRDQANFDAALIAFEAACRAKSDSGEAFINAGEVHWALGRAEDAEATLRRGLKLNPSCAGLHNALGIVLAGGGDIEAALQCYRQALAIDPDDVQAHSNLIFSLMFTSESHEPMLAESRRFNARFATSLSRNSSYPRHMLAGGSKLRIGYVSPDFCDHCQSLFTLPLFRNHDRSAFEIVCYASVKHPDDVTRLIAQQVDVFRDVSTLDDAALAAQVRADHIDVLVDLTMHMAHGRPLLFARRPAPVQVAWLAYPGTTGIEAISYRVSDPRLDPPGSDEHYTERTIRLPDAYWCYDPQSSLPPAMPSPRRNELTLGCLNNPCKLTDRTLRLWAPVLASLPQARLLLLAPVGRYRRALLQRASAAGIDTTRVNFVAHSPREEYLSFYRDVDFCLDTFPYNGHTTSLDALWMGVPFVTRIGRTSVGRGGLSLLFQLGLTELAADSDAEFLNIALALADDRPRLETLRLELRSRLERSPLMDGRRFARNIESAYRSICSHRGSASGI